MAGKVSPIFTIFLSFLVLSQSQARVQIHKLENLDTQWNPSNKFPDSDAMSTIKSPTVEFVESEPKDLPEFNTMDEIRVLKPFTGSYDGSFRPIYHRFHHNHVFG
ncbi:hypothetical protein NE237_007306 [Protea cynaroides]|uniref:Uncharacterized protein n=1 Tax=Protea cynaroides TaxID=273540 RepID=A0A9Q0KP59_9MAGN|nr:hypothetical protein NE237_007306 [Protea cynaroides]